MAGAVAFRKCADLHLNAQVGAGYTVAEGAELRDEVLAKAPRVSAT